MFDSLWNRAIARGSFPSMAPKEGIRLLPQTRAHRGMQHVPIVRPTGGGRGGAPPPSMSDLSRTCIALAVRDFEELSLDHVRSFVDKSPTAFSPPPAKH